MIDRVELQDKIRKYADDLIIDQLSETEIALFATKTKDIVEFAFDDYINEQYELYLNHIPANKVSIYSSFTDGYVARMKKWVANNGISLKPVELPKLRDIVDEQSNRTPDRADLNIALGGTAIAMGVSLLPKFLRLPEFMARLSPIAAIVIEIIALGLAYRAYKHKNTIETSTPKEPVRKEFKDDLDRLKECLIRGTWNQFDAWLDVAVEKSDSLLNFYIYE